MAEREWLEVAHSILTWLPHRGVYHDAVEAGRHLLCGNAPGQGEEDRGLVLLRLHWSGLLGETVSSEEILSAGRESLGLLPGPGNAPFRAAVVSMMADHGYAVSDDTVTDLLAQSFDEVVRRTGESDALDLLLQVTDILWRVDPARALAVTKDGRELVRSHAADERHQLHLVEEIRLLAEVYAAELPGEESGDLAERARIVRQRAEEENMLVPYGATQYYPFHLLIHGEQALAERWTVTYQPSLALMFRPTDRSAVAVRLRQSMTAIGIGFAGTPNSLPEAPAESAAIAGAVGGNVLPEADASPEALIRVLSGPRCIHLATHGRHSVTAPAFQYLMTAAGPLYAHQITSLDLRGLTLLTLSACETDFYASLAGGDTRRDAFARAQSSIRQRYPDFRHWGAFVLLGDWT